MSERHTIKIYQIPWLVICLAVGPKTHAFHASMIQFFIAVTMFQWWLKLLHFRKQAAELRLTHPFRPPPKPDPRLTTKEQHVLHKEVQFRCCFVGYPLMIFTYLSFSSQWFLSYSMVLWVPMVCIFTIDWFQMVIMKIGHALNATANQPSNVCVALSFDGDRVIKSPAKYGESLETASLLLMLDALNTTETLLLASLNLNLNILEQFIIFLCNSVREHSAQCTWLCICSGGELFLTLASRLARYMLILWCRMPKFKHVFSWFLKLPFSVRMFLFVDLPRLLLDLARSDPGDDSNLGADIEEIIGDSADSWTWQDMLHERFDREPSYCYQDHTHPCVSVCAPGPILYLCFGMACSDLPAPTFISPWSDGLNWRMRRHIKRVDEKLDSRLNRRIVMGGTALNASTPCDNPYPANVNCGANHLASFIDAFNPATAGISLLSIERFHGRHAPKQGSHRISVNMRTCLQSLCKHIASNVCTFPAYE